MSHHPASHIVTILCGFALASTLLTTYEKSLEAMENPSSRVDLINEQIAGLNPDQSTYVGIPESCSCLMAYRHLIVQKDQESAKSSEIELIATPCTSEVVERIPNPINRPAINSEICQRIQAPLVPQDLHLQARVPDQPTL